ncbi:MAG: hypothetical protein HFI75_03250 [Lachnospiraceae bacterium]|nr:hypothetical protein [Lachnospiraceae bacterium]
MKYVNAAEILPEQLIKEIQTYIDGSVLYVPKASTKKEWEAASGARRFYQERNKEIQKMYKEGYSIEELTEQYGLAYSTIKKIIYG